MIDDESYGRHCYLTGGLEPTLACCTHNVDAGTWTPGPLNTLTKPSDVIHRPAHYARFKIEPIYFIMSNNLPFEVGNVIKYVCRHDAKDGVKDLKKARRYLDMMIKKAEGDERFAE